MIILIILSTVILNSCTEAILLVQPLGNWGYREAPLCPSDLHWCVRVHGVWCVYVSAHVKRVRASVYTCVCILDDKAKCLSQSFTVLFFRQCLHRARSPRLCLDWSSANQRCRWILLLQHWT